MFLIDDILLAPVTGIVALARKLDEMINKELSDSGKIKEHLMKLQLRYEMDEISEEEFKKQEAELLARLDAIQEEKGAC